MILVVLDLLINNFTKYTSFFFIPYLYNKRYKDYFLVGIVFDYIFFNTYYINIVILSVIYFFNKTFKDLNKNNGYTYIFINIFNYIMFIILSNLFKNNSINIILISIGNNLAINIIFYILSFRMYKNSNRPYN